MGGQKSLDADRGRQSRQDLIDTPTTCAWETEEGAPDGGAEDFGGWEGGWWWWGGWVWVGGSLIRHLRPVGGRGLIVWQLGRLIVNKLRDYQGLCGA